MHFFHICFLSKHSIFHKSQWGTTRCQQMKWKLTLCNDNGFPTVYRRIHRQNFLTSSSQTSRCIRICIRMRQPVRSLSRQPFVLANDPSSLSFWMLAKTFPFQNVCRMRWHILFWADLMRTTSTFAIYLEISISSDLWWDSPKRCTM